MQPDYTFALQFGPASATERSAAAAYRLTPSITDDPAHTDCLLYKPQQPQRLVKLADDLATLAVTYTQAHLGPGDILASIVASNLNLKLNMSLASRGPFTVWSSSTVAEGGTACHALPTPRLVCKIESQFAYVSLHCLKHKALNPAIRSKQLASFPAASLHRTLTTSRLQLLCSLRSGGLALCLRPCIGGIASSMLCTQRCCSLFNVAGYLSPRDSSCGSAYSSSKSRGYNTSVVQSLKVHVACTGT
jgi:hypothetical protein